uniref:C2 domain-containing protein n=2 Tax=Lotharella globosa TaxID=91324 RepID=A0A6V3JWR5_9EUKA
MGSENENPSLLEKDSERDRLLDTLDPFLAENQLLKMDPITRVSEEEQLAAEAKIFGSLVNPFRALWNPKHDASEGNDEFDDDVDEKDLEDGERNPERDASTRKGGKKELRKSAKKAAREFGGARQGANVEIGKIDADPEIQGEQMALLTEKQRLLLMDEGLYVPPVSAATKRNRAFRATRLLRENHSYVAQDFDRRGAVREPEYKISDGTMRVIPPTADQIRYADTARRVEGSSFGVVSSRIKMLQLAVRLSEVVFDDHPVMNAQDTLAVRASELYREYQTRVAIDLVTYHKERIEALEKSADQLMEQHNKAIASNDSSKERYYRAKLISTLEQSLVDRELRDREELELRQLFKDLYDVWSSLRAVRLAEGAALEAKNETKVKQGETTGNKDQTNAEDRLPECITNPMLVRVKRVQLNQAEEQRAFAKDLELELKARAQLERLETPEGIDGKMAKSSLPSLSTRASVEARMQKCRKRPGRPLYLPIVRPSALVLSNDRDCTEVEQNRRKREASTRIYLVLKVNGRTVTRTRSVPLERRWPRVAAAFDEVVQINLHAPPKTMAIEIVQEGVLAGYRLSECRLSLPELGTQNEQNEQARMIRGAEIRGSPSFWNSSTLTQSAKAQLSILQQPRRVRGSFDIAMQWVGQERLDVKHQTGDVIRPPSNQLGTEGKRRAARGEALDPNHPDNLALLERQRRAASINNATTLSSGSVFRVSKVPSDLVYTDLDAPETNTRKLVLQARNLGVLPGNVTVPLKENDIPDHLCEYADPQRVQELKLKQKNRKNYSETEQLGTGDVVSEVIPAFMAVNLWTGKIFDWMTKARRLLRPVRQMVDAKANPTSCRLMIQVIRGQNIPVRSDRSKDFPSQVWVDINFQGSRRRSSVSSGANPTWNELLELPIQRPSEEMGFSPIHMLRVNEPIRINLFDRKETIRPADRGFGQLHTWEEQWLGCLEIPFQAVYLSRPVFGAFHISVPPMSLDHNIKNPNQPTRLWFYLTLDPPLALPKGFRPGQTASDPPDDWFDNSAFNRYCKMWKHKARKKALARAQGALQGGAVDPQDANRERYITALAMGHDGKPILVCRYIRPLKPPRGLEEVPMFTRFAACVPCIDDNDESTSDLVVDYWCTVKEFLTLGGGDEEEHAVMLCNFFKYTETRSNRHLDRHRGASAGADAGASDSKEPANADQGGERVQEEGEDQSATLPSPSSSSQVRWCSYVCTGTHVNGLAVTWVVRIGPKESKHTKHRHRVLMYNPIDGHRYDVYRDRTTLPLRSVGAIFDENNIWANIQESAKPWEIEYSLDRGKWWSPLFTMFHPKSSFEEHTTCVQPPVHYTITPAAYYQARAAEIERLIEKHFEKVRESSL